MLLSKLSLRWQDILHPIKIPEFGLRGSRMCYGYAAHITVTYRMVLKRDILHAYMKLCCHVQTIGNLAITARIS